MASLKTSEAAVIDKPVEMQVEGDIREFVRRDVSTLRRQSDSDSEMVANNIGSLLARVSGSSVKEIDKLITELQTLREMLHNEGARVQREIVEYADLTVRPPCSQPGSSRRASHTGRRTPDAPSMREN